ncbi:hypothetical protein BS17DRAFT_441300 [Gyrodon lividus]|nr:hypothetical protein BS17DRAFT_441300 [Gyrodon lividus]
MSAAGRRNPRERTAATFTLLKLCEDDTLRKYLFDNKVLDIFINQLQRKDSSLLAAYALTICLKHDEMKHYINHNQLVPKYIVNMLRLDYFDDAVGQVEGFQIFGDFMKQDHLRGEIRKYDITTVLERKLGNGQPKEIRTSLICLDIFRSFDEHGPWIGDLVQQSLEHLKKEEWRTQKAGVTILSALAQTEYGVKAIEPHIQEIVEMLLPRNYLPIPETSTNAASESVTQPGEMSPTDATSSATQPGETQPTGAASESATHPGATPPAAQPPSHHSRSVDDTPSVDLRPKPPSWMLGPACALRVLSEDETLRKVTRKTMQYESLKHLYLSGYLVDDVDPSAWRVKTPTKDDVLDMLDKMIKAVDEEFSEDGLTSVGDTVLPHIQHWDRLAALIRDSVVGIVTVLPVVLGVSALTIVALIVATPFVLSYKLVQFVGRLVWFHRQSHIVDRLQLHPGDVSAIDIDTPSEVKQLIAS